MTNEIDIFELRKIEPGVRVIQAPPYRNIFLAYVDIIGYKNLINAQGSSAPNYINLLFMQAVEWNTWYKYIDISILSDAIIATTYGDHPAEFFNLHNVVQNIIRTLLKSNLLSRGAIVLGEHSQNENILVSPALIEAYTLEQQADFPRLLISQNVVDKILPSMENVEGANHLSGVRYNDQVRLVDKNIIIKDEEDLNWIADLFSCEPFYCLKHGKTMNQWPGDAEISQEDFRPIYDQAITELTTIRNNINGGLQTERDYPNHYKKWSYLKRKFNKFLNSAHHLKQPERIKLLIPDPV